MVSLIIVIILLIPSFLYLLMNIPATRGITYWVVTRAFIICVYYPLIFLRDSLFRIHQACYYLTSLLPYHLIPSDNYFVMMFVSLVNNIFFLFYNPIMLIQSGQLIFSVRGVVYRITELHQFGQLGLYVYAYFLTRTFCRVCEFVRTWSYYFFQVGRPYTGPIGFVMVNGADRELAGPGEMRPTEFVVVSDEHRVGQLVWVLTEQYSARFITIDGVYYEIARVDDPRMTQVVTRRSDRMQVMVVAEFQDVVEPEPYLLYRTPATILISLKECSICREEMMHDVVLLGCNHMMCYTCVNRIRGGVCPFCRSPI